jgi:[FeFe] hydrogenase (group B1/B3)
MMGRCCVYKEREIIRSRINLACGENVPENPFSENQVQVIKAACDECPIQSYTVTDNCRLCLGRPCIESCKFGAISTGQHRSFIEPTKCKECGLCAKACPFEAIIHLTRPCKRACPADAISYDEYGYCQIDESNCINCGHCVHACPFGAISTKTYLVPIIQAIKAGKEVFLMCAPATEGQYGDKVGITMGSIRAAAKKLGFKDMVEVGLGGDMTAANEALEWSEARKEGRKMTTSCCPAFVGLLQKHFPMVAEKYMSSSVSPMCGVSRYLKTMYPGCVTVFAGPCVAKKAESADRSVEGNADYVMTFGELETLFRSKDIKFEPIDDGYQEASIWGKRFANSGGVANAVLQCMQERGEDTTGMKLLRCSGGDECKKALQLLKLGRLPEDFVEGMVCEGGCIGGPSRHKQENELKRNREALLKKADDRKVLDNLAQYPMDLFSMFRDGHIGEEWIEWKKELKEKAEAQAADAPQS